MVVRSIGSSFFLMVYLVFQITAQDPCPEGIELYNDKKFEEARNALLNCNSVERDSNIFYLNKYWYARTMVDGNLKDSAKEMLNHLCEIDNKYFSAKFLAIEAKAKLGMLKDIDGSLMLFEKLDSLSSIFGDKFQRGRIKSLLGQVNAMFSRHEQSLKYHYEALAIDRENPINDIALFQGAGLSADALGLDTAKYLLIKGSMMADSIVNVVEISTADSSRISGIHESYGNYLVKRGKLREAAELILKGIDYKPKSPLYTLSRIKGYYALIDIFFSINDSDRAIYYLNLAKSELSNLTRKVSIAVEKSTLAGLFLTAQQMETAEQFAREALADLKDPRYAKQVTECYYTLCYVAIQKNKLDEATSNFEFAEKQLEFIRDEDYKMKIELLGAKVYYKTGRLNEAFQLANKVLEKAKKENKIALQQQSYSQLATIANKLGQYKKSLAYTIRFHELKDSVYLNKQNQYVQELDAKYQKAEQDLSIAELSLENEKNEARILLKNKQQVLYIIGLVSFALLGLSLFVLYSNNKMNSRELLTKNKIITKALSEKELLLKEIHHRVKNNLQVISSLLSIQSRFIKDPLAVSAINEGRNRVKSMAIIHQDLYRNDNLKGVNVEDYFEKLFESLFSSYNIKEDKIKLTAEIENIELDIDTIVPIGLIVNELISNALKYAFPENREGNIHIRLIEKNDKLILSIEDDGIGFNSTTELKKEESFGHELIDAFAQKLDASVSIESADGTSVIIEISNYKIAS